MTCPRGAIAAFLATAMALAGCSGGGRRSDVATDARDIPSDPGPDLVDSPDAVEAPEAVAPDCPGACCDDGACDDGDPCTVDRCEARACVHLPASCDDGDPCTEDSCEAPAGCHHASIAGCCQPGSVQVLLELDFDQGLGDLLVEEFGASSPTPGTWHASSLKYRSAGQSLRFGVPETGDYDNGRRVAARLETPTVALPSDRRAELAFWLWLDVEPDDATDLFSVAALTGDQRLPLFAKRAELIDRSWHEVVLDVTALAGGDVAVELAFDSVTAADNALHGIYLDDVALRSICAPPACPAGAACDDGLICTSDACHDDPGRCAFTPVEACCLSALDCRDADACTLDACVTNACTWQPEVDPACCNTDDDCSDVDACTHDTCLDGRCTHTPSGAAGCCATDVDCDDGDPCTRDRCVDGACVLAPACCDDDLDCDDGDDACTVDLCVEGGCRHVPSGIAGCCAALLVELAFDDGSAGGFVFAGSSPEVGWRVFGGAGASSAPTPALYYGDDTDPQALGYDNGSANWGSATLPLTLVPAASGLTLHFDAFLATEATPDYDTLTFTLVQEGRRHLLWDKSKLVETDAWHAYTIDLSAFAGGAAELVLRFDTVDDTSNQGEGVYVDDLRVTSSCLPRACQVDADCDDGLPSTEERCLPAGICAWQPKSTPCAYAFECDDQAPCTADVCQAGYCENTPIPGCCTEAADCDDQDACTSDTCDPANACHHAWTPGCCLTSAGCDDGDPCTLDACSAVGGTCSHGAVEGCCSLNRHCDDLDPATTDACTPQGCAHLPLACGTTADCSDGDACTGDACLGGACTWLPLAEPACCQPLLLDATFDDGTPGPFSLLAASPGEPWSISEARADGSPSSLHLAATAADGAPTARAVSRTLHLPWNSALSLSFSLWTDVEPADGLDPFTVRLLTDLGPVVVWTGADRQGLPGDWAVQQIALDAYAGQAVQLELRYEPGAGGPPPGEGIYVDSVRVTTTCSPASCEADGDCASFDACAPSRCVGGLCVGAPVVGCCAADVECADGNACTDDGCPTVGGACAHAWRAHCCLTEADCDDADPCTADACTGPGGLCTHDAIEGCCLVNADCDDRSPATIDLCQAGACRHAPATCAADVDCDDGDPCTEALCLSGACAYQAVAGAPCCQSPLLAADFDAGSGHPFVLSPGGWHLSSAEHGDSAPASLHVGPLPLAAPSSDPTPAPWLATATSAPLALPPAVEARLTFSAYGDLAAPSGAPRLQIRVLGDAGPVPVWTDLDLEPPTSGWVRYEADLGAFQGQSIRLQLRFEAADAPALSGGGLWIDDVRLETTCAPPPCDSGVDCPAGGPCRVAACVAGGCRTVQLPGCCVTLGDCDDDDVCTTDRCQGGTCAHEHQPGCCNVAADCDDGAPCTLDTCDAQHACVHPYDPVCSTPLPYTQSFNEATSLTAIGWSARNQAGGPGTNWELTGSKAPFDQHLMFDDTPVVQTYAHQVMSPRLTIPEGLRISFAWAAFFDAYTAATTETSCSAEVSADDGVTWSPLWSATYKKTGSAPEELLFDVTGLLAGSTTARVAFSVSGQTSYDLLGWHLDDIRVLTGEAPLVDEIGPQTAVVGEITELLFTASDPEGDPLVATLEPSVGAWARVEARTAPQFALVLEPGAAEIGPHQLTLAVSDGQFQVTRAFLVTVAGPAILLAENFDTAPSLDELGWSTEVEAGSAPHWGLAALGGVNGSPAAEFDWYPTVSNFAETLLSPPFDASLAADADVQLVFSHRLDLTGSFEGTLVAKASADGGETWSPVWTREIAGAADLGPEAVIVPAGPELGASPTARVAFTLAGKSTYPLASWHVDSVRVIVGSPPEVAPVAPATAPIGETRDLVLHATDADGDELRFQLLDELPFLALVPLGPNAASLRATPQPSDWGTYVVGVLVGDGLFTTRLEVTLTVRYDGETLLLHEDFDNLTGLSAGGWSITQGAGSLLAKHWGLVDASPLGDSPAAAFGPNPVVSTYLEDLVSPVLTGPVPAGAHVRLDFGHALVLDEPSTVALSLRVSPDGGASWSPAWSLTATPETLGVGPETRSLDLSPWLAAASQPRLAFRIEGAASDTLTGWYVDDVLLVILDPP